jgi:transitional endoplasmic reticulum ATPase
MKSSGGGSAFFRFPEGGADGAAEQQQNGELS